MNSRTLIAALALLGGSIVQAVELDLHPDKALYKPGEAVRLLLEHRQPERPRTVSATLKIFALEREVYRETKPLDLSQPEALQFTWTPPDNPAGYGAELTLSEPGDGRVLQAASTAFDVHQSWLEAPRYGFLSDFGPGQPDGGRVAELAKYHLNALQFYDWMYRHDDHLPPSAEFTDPLGRKLSLDTVKRRIEEAHAAGLAAMPYTTLYGASLDYFRAHPDQALFHWDGKPWAFGDNFLMTMNPSEGSGWREHILGEYQRILEALPFDGLHIDQYGDPKTAYDQQGRTVQLAEVIPGFLQAAKAVAKGFPGRDAVVFNMVNDWPSETVSPSGVDLSYIEVWPPHEDYASLRDLVYANRQRSGGKPVVLAAYLTPKADPATRLLDAVIAASGGTHIELGENGGILADPYFPKYEHPGPELSRWLRRYYDFITRYQHYLYSGTGVANLEGLEVSGAPFSTGSYPSNKVWGLASRGEGFTALHFINLTASPAPYWRIKKDAPKVLSGLQLSYKTAQKVRAVFAASPDDPVGSLQTLEFIQSGGTVRAKLPRLRYWTMVVLQTEGP